MRIILFVIFLAVGFFCYWYLIPYYGSVVDISKINKLTLYRIDPNRMQWSSADLQKAPQIELSIEDIQHTFGQAKRTAFLPFWKGSYLGIGKTIDGTPVKLKISVTNDYFQLMGWHYRYALDSNQSQYLEVLYDRNFIGKSDTQ